jgi:hypothetical protein
LQRTICATNLAQPFGGSFYNCRMMLLQRLIPSLAEPRYLTRYTVGTRAASVGG